MDAKRKKSEPALTAPFRAELKQVSLTKATMSSVSFSLTPDSEQRGQLHAVAENPAEGDHGGDPVPSVDSRVHAVVRDHHVSAQTGKRE